MSSISAAERVALLALIPKSEQGCSINWNASAQRWYVFRWLGTTYDPKRKRGVDRRESIGYIKDGQFHYSKRYLLQKQVNEANAPSAEQSSAKQTVQKATDAVSEFRQTAKVQYPMDIVLTVMLLASLAGYTGAVSIALYWKLHRKELENLFENFPDKDISHDTVNRIMRQIEPEEFSKLVQAMTELLVRQFEQRILNGDGQCVRASRHCDDQSGCYFFNVYDATNCLLLFHSLVDDKTNEIPAAYTALQALDIKGCMLTFDAMNTQKQTAELIVQRGAQYCLAVKENQPTLFKEVIYALNTSQQTQCCQNTDADHGRIEIRDVTVAPASLLSQSVLSEWTGLSKGCLVKVRLRTQSKRNYETEVKQSDDTRYFISSMPFKTEGVAERMCDVIRRHWSVENRLHWTLDTQYNQDRVQCKDKTYLQNRVSLNKLSLNFLQQGKIRAQETYKLKYSIKTLMQMCATPGDALELLHELFEKKY